MTTLAFFALGVFARCAIARAFEVDIPLAARAAATKHKLLPLSRKIDNWIECGVRTADCGLIRVRSSMFDVQCSMFSARVVRYPFFLGLTHQCSHRHAYDLIRSRTSRHLFAH